MKSSYARFHGLGIAFGSEREDASVVLGPHLLQTAARETGSVSLLCLILIRDSRHRRTAYAGLGARQIVGIGARHRHS